ncbi:helix-turn-helix domain-containing protein [Aquabacter sp. L1I39]|uniref:helix-turn-helix domain-containing protein n=1 Tax=Aquabacter sp. L1I39 TaxID=2820278 RepID=UPI001FFC5D9C|nr:helix-turn-helix transcriptional regulator [Aquabacter sp. L1I39]
MSPGPGAFGARLRTWRRMNGIKQEALAHVLGVSQTAISIWENGHDLPSAARLVRIESLMAKVASSELAVERLFVERQQGVRALFDADGTRLLAVSRGYRALWPQTAELQGSFFVEYLVNEARHITTTPALAQAILSGDLVLASGYSLRMTSLQLDEMVPHRWHACFRRYGARTIVDVVTEPGEDARETGIDDLVYLDDIRPE